MVAASFTGSELAFDKNWIACDNWRLEPAARPLLPRVHGRHARLPGVAIQRSDDGGQTWSAGQVVLRDPKWSASSRSRVPTARS